MKKGIGRRVLEAGLGVVLGSLSLGAGAGCSQNAGFAGSANEYLRAFPERIIGAQEVKKFETPGARYCLVHIRQAHLTGDVEKNDLVLAKIVKIQTNIYHTVNELRQRGFLNEIYAEGMTPEFSEAYNAGVHELYRKGLKTSFISDASFQLMIDRLKVIGAENEVEWGMARDELGRWNKEIEELVKSAGTQPAAELKKSVKVRTLETDRKLIDRLIDRREDGVLRVIARNNARYAVVIYGSAHAFGGNDSFGERYDLREKLSKKDNIAVWNAKWPASKFSLIEVKPLGIK